jgi:cytochrome c biogenesis protein CcdA
MLTAINDTINSLLAQPTTALLAGMVAAFTPCTITVIPILLYRLGIWGGDDLSTNKVERSWRLTLTEAGMLIIGFMTSFGLTGAAFQLASNSQYANVTKLTLGMLLVLAAALLLVGRLRVQSLLRISHPIVLGLTLPLVVSLSPCVIPFVSVLLSPSSGANGLLRFFLFGLGILVPGILIGLVGHQLVTKVRWFSRSVGKIEAASPFLLALTGLYMSISLIGVTQGDVHITALILGLVTAVAAYRILIVKGYASVRNFTWLTGITLLAVVMTSFAEQAAPATDPLRGITFIIACSEDFLPSLKHLDIVLPLVIWVLALSLWYVVAGRPETSGMKIRLVGLTEAE